MDVRRWAFGVFPCYLPISKHPTRSIQRPMSNSDGCIQHWTLGVRRSTFSPMLVKDDKLAAIRGSFPKEGLFAEKDWLLSPDAFPIEKKFQTELEQLGHRLLVFQRACNQLYQLSVKGKQPAWVARYLDAGKPKELIEFSQRKEIRDDLPRVIRPDLILTDDGYIIAEIDSVPGGIGLTGWLNQTYSSFDSEIIGGADGMLAGFQSVLPNGGDIVISQEAATYRPEMEWVAARLNQKILDSGSSILDQEKTTRPESSIQYPESSIVADSCGRKLRAARRRCGLPLLRTIRSAEHSKDRKSFARER